MNTLANHGYISRNGTEITREEIINALSDVVGLDKTIAWALTEAVFVGSGLVDKKTGRLSLAALREHNKIEHDMSLTRQDAYFGDDWTFDPDLFQNMLSHSFYGTVLTIEELGRFRQERYQQCKRDDPELKFGVKEEAAALFEASALIALFGNDDKTISLDVLRSIFADEKLPIEAGWTKRKDVGNSRILPILLELKIASGIFH